MFASSTSGRFDEARLDPVDQRLGRTRVHPADEAEREEVLRALGVARLHAERLGRLDGDRGHRHLVHAERGERVVAQRVLLVARLVEVARVERVDVDEQRRARHEVARGSPSAPRGSSRRARSACRPASRCRGPRCAPGTTTRRRSCPAGARISAGKLGSVARSLPNTADSSVNRSPTSCMPSPESPANLITTRSSVFRAPGRGRLYGHR